MISRQTDLISDMADIRISPHGRLLLAGHDGCCGNGFVLLDLLRMSAVGMSPAMLFFKRVFADYVQLIPFDMPVSGRDVVPVFLKVHPDASRVAALALSAPPMVGGEYLDAGLMNRFFLEFEEHFQLRFEEEKGDLADFVRSLSPDLKNVGKLVFHLAEHKDDESGCLPFAFMVSFHYQMPNGQMRHLPLASAVKAYLGDKAALNAILEPVQEAAAQCPLLQELLNSRRIFQPVAWGCAEAYTFLQHVPEYERLNIELSFCGGGASADLPVP